MREFRWILIGALVWAIPLHLLAKPPSKTTRVDCGKGESVSAALDDPSPNLIIEVSGVCAEYVRIARDNVTLRGVDAPAAIDVSTLPEPHEDAITIEGAANVVIAAVAVRNARYGVAIRYGSAAMIDGVTAEGNAVGGILAADSSSVRVRNCVARSNGFWGISAWSESSMLIIGTVTASGNARIGIIADASSVEFSGAVRLEADDNGSQGMQFQQGASFLGSNVTSVATRRNRGYGVAVLDSKVTVSQLECTGNLTGVLVTDGIFSARSATIGANQNFGIQGVRKATIELSACSVNGNRRGIDAAEASHLTLRDTQLTGNLSYGLRLDGGTGTMQSTNITSNGGTDAMVTFGTRVTFLGGANTVGTMQCDGNVLVRGDVGCTSTSLSGPVSFAREPVAGRSPGIEERPLAAARPE